MSVGVFLTAVSHSQGHCEAGRHFRDFRLQI